MWYFFAMPKLFLSYRYSGEDPKSLRPTITQICDLLRAGGNDLYCSYESEAEFLKKQLTDKQMLDEALECMRLCSHIVLFVNSQEVSQGMLIELGFAHASGLEVVLLIRKGVHSRYFYEFTSPELILEFNDLDDLYAKLPDFKIND